VSSWGWSHIPATYDVVAEEYAAAFSDELDAKPFDRELLDGLAREVAGRGLVCDLGCGPGQIGAYLAQRGCDVVGIDISPGMLLSAGNVTPMCGSSSVTCGRCHLPMPPAKLSLASTR
jgi:trans-aconitate methyltransferase